jgi:hypothetical protein
LVCHHKSDALQYDCNLLTPFPDSPVLVKSCRLIKLGVATDAMVLSKHAINDNLSRLSSACLRQQTSVPSNLPTPGIPSHNSFMNILLDAMC